MINDQEINYIEEINDILRKSLEISDANSKDTKLSDNILTDDENDQYRYLKQATEAEVDAIKTFFEDLLKEKDQKSNLQLENAITILDSIIKHSNYMSLLGSYAKKIQDGSINKDQIKKVHNLFFDDSKYSKFIEDLKTWMEAMQDPEQKDKIPTPEQYTKKAQILQPLLNELKQYKEHKPQDLKIPVGIINQLVNTFSTKTILVAQMFYSAIKSLFSHQKNQDKIEVIVKSKEKEENQKHNNQHYS